MIGAEELVPPKTSQPTYPWYDVESYTATPVLGSATADTSAFALRVHPVTALSCQASAFAVEQPLPAPFHAVSPQPRALLLRTRCVPPTATTCEKDAGASTP